MKKATKYLANQLLQENCLTVKIATFSVTNVYKSFGIFY